MRNRRETWTGRSTEAWCCECEWEAFTRNAQGIAAQHHDRTGHTVRVEVESFIVYGDKAKSLYYDEREG